MNLKKISLLLTSAALITSLVGCFGDDEDDAADGITITGFAVTGPAQGSFWLEGSVNSATAIDSVSYTVKDADGVEVDAEIFDYSDMLDTLNETAFVFGEDAGEVFGTETEIIESSLACGTFTIEATVYAGASSNSASATFTKDTDCETPVGVNPQTVTLGSTNASEPSSIDLDSWTTYSYATSVEAAADIDLFYGTQDGADRLYSPAAAKDAGFGSATSGPSAWATTSDVVMLITSDITRAAFDAIENASDLATVAADAINVDNLVDSAPVEAGQVYVVVSSDSKMFLVLIDTQVAGAAGNIVIKSLAGPVE